MRQQTGAALVETAILMTVFVPVFIGIPLLGKYLDIQAATLDAGRYAVWERTVWSVRGHGWNEGENQKSDAAVARETNAFVIGHPSSPVGVTGAGISHPLWVNRKQEKLLSGVSGYDEHGRPIMLRSRVGLLAHGAPVSTPIVDQLAYKGVPGGGIASAVSNATTGLGKLSGNCGPGVDLAHGLNLGSDNFVEATVAIPAHNHIVPNMSDLTFAAKAAILSNSWAAPDYETYRGRVDRLTVDELVGCAVIPGRFTFAVLSTGPDSPLYGEGINSFPVLEAFDPDALPADRHP